MMSLRYITIVLTTLILACKNNQAKPIIEKATTATDTNNIAGSPKSETEKLSKTVDTIKRFIVDDYPITDEMLDGDINGKEIKSGDVRSLGHVWFSNDTLNQTLVYELHTDKFRMISYLFFNNNIPPDLIKNMEFNTGDGGRATNAQKLKNFKGFLSLTKKINGSYFATNKGFKLGDNINKAIKIYAKPDIITTKNGIDEYYWEFIGDILYDGKTSLRDKPLAKDSFGHQIRMFFKNKKLIGLIIHNDIP